MMDYYEIEGIDYNRDKSRSTLEDFIVKGNTGTLCIIQSLNDPIGYFCIAFSYTLEHYGKDCFLDEIYIKPEFRHKGIGTEVMKYIENYLEQNNFKAIHLIVYDKNPAAFKYYVKNGFQVQKASFMSKLLNQKSKISKT